MVVIEAEHLCMSMRGVRKPGAKTVTSAVRGSMRDSDRTPAEAMSLLCTAADPPARRQPAVCASSPVTACGRRRCRVRASSRPPGPTHCCVRARPLPCARQPTAKCASLSRTTAEVFHRSGTLNLAAPRGRGP